MAYGAVNVPGVTGAELEAVRKIAQAAKETAEAAQEAITEMTTKISAVPSQGGVLTYNGQAQSPSWNNYDPNALTIGGTQSATDAGTYQVTFTPKEGYKWEDGTTTAKTVNWTIGRANIATPSQSGSLTYTGSAQSPTWANYDSAKMTLGGTNSGTNAGSYTATFTPGKNYQWSDGTTTAKSITWKINKAAGSLTLNKSSLTLSGGTATGTVTATRSGDGVISASSNKTDVATVSVSGTTITITAKGSGTATITVKCAEGTNHTAPANKTVSVTVKMASPSLEDNDPATIKEAAQSGQAANLWSAGDKMPIAVNGKVGSLTINGTYYAFILGFNHNSSVEVQRVLQQQRERPIRDEHQQYQLRRLGEQLYAPDHLPGVPLGTPGGMAERDCGLHQVQRQPGWRQQHGQLRHGDAGQNLAAFGVRGTRLAQLREQRGAELPETVRLLQERQQQGEVQSQRDRHRLLLVAPLRRCGGLELLLLCGRGRRRVLQQRVLVDWLRAGL